MEGKIITIEGFKAVGITYFGNNSNGEIPKLWGAFNQRCNEITDKSRSSLYYGICDDAPDSEGRFHYTACAEVDSFKEIPTGMETKVVPNGKYLVYTFSEDLKNIGEFYNNLFANLLPASGQEIDFRPQLELYDEKFMDNGEFDIYIPIK